MSDFNIKPPSPHPTTIGRENHPSTLTTSAPPSSATCLPPQIDTCNSPQKSEMMETETTPDTSQCNNKTLSIQPYPLPLDMLKSEQTFKNYYLSASSDTDTAETFGIDLNAKPYAHGGMCKIYKTERYPNHIVRVVPLKIVSTRLLAKSVFYQSVAAQNHLAPQIKHVILTPSTGFELMDLIEGCTLNEWNKDDTRTFKEYLDVFLKVLKTVLQLHNLNIIHGDFTMGNVMLTHKELEVMLIDFDLSNYLVKTSDYFNDQTDIDTTFINTENQESYDVEIRSLGYTLLRLMTRSQRIKSYFKDISEFQKCLTESIRKFTIDQKHLESIVAIGFSFYKFCQEEHPHPTTYNLDATIQEIQSILDALNSQETLDLPQLSVDILKSEKIFNASCPSARSNKEAAALLGIDLHLDPYQKGAMNRLYKTKKYPHHIVRLTKIRNLSTRLLVRGYLCHSIAAKNQLAPRIKHMLITKSHCFTLMDHIEGNTLMDWTYNKKQTFKDCMTLFLNILKTTLHLHNLNIIHNDLSMLNIMLKSKNSSVILIDFDLSYSLHERLCETTNESVIKIINNRKQEGYETEIGRLSHILLKLMTRNERTKDYYEDKNQFILFLTEKLIEFDISQKELACIGDIGYRLYNFSRENHTFFTKFDLESVIEEIEYLLTENQTAPSGDSTHV